jgi:hypothetical protein
MSDCNISADIISSELIRIAAEAWILVQNHTNAAAFDRAVGAVSSMSGVEAATAVGAAGSVLAFVASKATGRRVPLWVHLALRTVATNGIVPGVALTFPVTSVCLVGMWGVTGLHALNCDIVPWSLRMFLNSGLIAMRLRGFHPLMIVDVVALELAALQHVAQTCPIPTAVAVLASWWLSATIAGYVTRALRAASNLVCQALRFVMACVVGTFKAAFWSFPRGVVRLFVAFLWWSAAAAKRQEDFFFDEIETDGPSAFHGPAIVVDPVTEVEVFTQVEPTVVAPEKRESAAISFVGPISEGFTIMIHTVVAAASRLHGSFGSLRTDGEPLAEFDFGLDDEALDASPRSEPTKRRSSRRGGSKKSSRRPAASKRRARRAKKSKSSNRRA